MFRKIFAVLPLITLVACSIPAYDQALNKNLDKVSDSIGNIYARVNLVPDESVDFASLEGYFTEAQAGLNAAQNLVQNKPAGRDSARTRSVHMGLQESLNNCRDSLNNLVLAAKRRPMTPGRINAFSTDIVCDYTARTAGLLTN